MRVAERKIPLVNSRFVLMAGFGGLLILMAFAGLDGLQALDQIQSSNDTIREGFLLRTRVLERIRADVYVSGTYVRDYLLEPESGKAEGHRYSLLETRRDIEEALDRYHALINVQEREPFDILTRELADYWNVLQPIFEWTPEQRREGGYLFLRDEVFPRRLSMLAIADRIGDINESQLNAGKNKVEVAYRASRRRLAITLSLTILLGLVLAGFTIRSILKLETAMGERYREIEEARAELKKLSARLVEAQEQERRSISRELHDEVGQSLSGILVEMANLTTMIRARDLDAVSGKVGEIKKELEDSIKVVRNMALLLRPSMLDDLGLVPALEWQAREVSKRSGIRVQVDADDVFEELPEEHKTCVYRVVQEALHNIMQHAAARTARIMVRQEQHQLYLSIEDDGKGFDPTRSRGMGLLGMQERVSHLDGKVLVDSEPGRGTRLIVKLPLPVLVAS